MALNADTLLDRLYLKTQITRWRLLAIVFAVATVLVATNRIGGGHSPIEKDFVARVTLDGIIGDDLDLYDLLDDVAENPKAKAVIVWLDTPGGSAVGGEEIFFKLRAIAEKKPVVAVMRSVSASAGYLIALGADHIVAREGTITGSIGVLIETAEVTELAEKLGITPIVVKSSHLKGSPSPLEKSTPEVEATIRAMIMDFYNRFVDIVADRRKLPRNKVLELADGRVYSGRSAVEYKLVDAIGGEDEAFAWLVENRQIKPSLEIRDIELDPQKDWIDAISQTLAGKFFQKSSLGLDGLVSVWHPELR